MLWQIQVCIHLVISFFCIYIYASDIIHIYNIIVDTQYSGLGDPVKVIFSTELAVCFPD